MIKAEREAKQHYLREEIIEMDYDSELFMWYIEGIREADIDSWNFDDLQDCVRGFKEKYRPGMLLQEVIAKQTKAEKEKIAQNDKNKLIQSEIIDKDFDPELFYWFIGEVQPNISLWEFDHLQEKVVEFKEKYNKSSTLQEILTHNDKKQLDEREGKDQGRIAIHFFNDSEEIKEDFEEKGKTTGYLDVNSEKIRCISPLPIRKTINSNGSLCIEENHYIEEEIAIKNKNEELKEETEECVEFQSSDPSIPQTEVEIKMAQETSKPFVAVRRILSCATVPETSITLISELHARISEPIIVKAGFFSKKFIQYEVSIESMSWAVKRRYNDFLWIRNLLLITNSGSYIPPIPQKKSTGNFSESFIRKRQKFLTDFLNSALMDKCLRSSKDFIEFLSNDNPKSFEDYKRSRKDAKKPESFEEISTIDGETLCDYDEDSSLFDCLNNYLDVSESLEKEFKDCTHSLIMNTEKLSKDIREFSDILTELQDLQDLLPNNSNNSQLFESVNSCLTKWATHEEINAKNLTDDLKLHFSYKIKEKPVFRLLIKEREHHLANFKRYKNKKKQEELAQNLKNMFGHFNYKIKSELERKIEDIILVDYLHFQDLASNEISKCESLQAFWTSTSTEFYKAPKLI